jgi:hypothetical protein
LPLDVLQSGWLGFPGATEGQITAAESRLGIENFPPSYRQFLAFTNGWLNTGTFIDHLWSTEEVDWLQVRNADLIEIYSTNLDPVLPNQRYFNYDDDEAASYIRAEHLKTALEISDMGDSALYILNPKVVDADGEWEAWFYASWLPGFRRYPSFWALMQAEYQSFRQLDTQENIRYYPQKTAASLRDKLPGLVQELQRSADEIAQSQQPTGGLQPYTMLTSGYNTGYIEALRDAAQRVQTLMEDNTDESTLLSGLHQLSTTLGREAQALQPKMSTQDILWAAFNLSRTNEIMGNGGAHAGKQKAAGIIEWFLHG